ncbi:hypothetical protein ACFL1A_03330 [Patescibacteria group bacterium]
MGDLPKKTKQIPDDQSQIHVPDPQKSDDTQPEITGSVGMAKEVMNVPAETNERSYLNEVGKETELTKEVSSAGVSLSPSAVSVSKLSGYGVKPAGENVAVDSGKNVTLPLSDDQIATGLKQSVSSSWRWLAEFCIRKLKKLHLSLKDVHGKIIKKN